MPAAEPSIALLSTDVAPEGTQTTITGLKKLLVVSFSNKVFYHFFSNIKSAITPSLIGLIARIFPGVLPNIVLAS